jgi:uncharacterized membrane protein
MEPSQQDSPSTNPAQHSNTPAPAHKPPDQKTVDALLAVTKAQMDQEATQKQAQKERDAPHGMIAGPINKMATTFDPEALTTSAAARRKAFILVIGFVVLTILSFVATKFMGSLNPF